jgi:hypothetical protein
MQQSGRTLLGYVNPCTAFHAAAALLLSPLSQMKQVVDASGHRLLGYVNVHSGEWALYTPWDSKPAYGSGMPVSAANDL